MNDVKPEHKQGSNKQEEKTFAQRLIGSLKKPKFLIEVLALVGLAFYVGETRRTNNLTQIALKDTQDNFIKDQRPYIWSSALKTNPMKAGEKLSAHVFFANYGKTPALKSGSGGKILWGKDALEQADEWFTNWDNSPPEIRNSSMIVPPGIPPPDKEENYRDYILDTSSGHLLCFPRT